MPRSTTRRKLRWHAILLPVANKGKSRILPTGDEVVGLADVDVSMQCKLLVQVILGNKMKPNKLQCRVL